MSNLSIHYQKASDLKVWRNNARTHSKKQIRQIADSIEQFGFTNPVLIDSEGRILAGHGRVAAAELIGMKEVPCVLLAHMSEAEKRAYVIADNKHALNAGWDEDLLAIELGALAEMDLDFDLEVTGFSAAEIDLRLADNDQDPPTSDEDEAMPAAHAVEARCKPGDIGQLGPHRLICGDARNSDTISRLMAGEKAQMVFTDPPYNVKIEGHVSGLGAVKHREFAMAAGEMSESQFTSFLSEIMAVLTVFSEDGSIHFICMDWRHLPEILEAGKGAYSELKNLITWVKDNGGMGTFYRSRHELILAYKNGTAPHRNNFELGQHGRYRTNVWNYRGMNSMSATRQDDLALHPTVKPVQLVADAILDVSARNGIVLDLFGGSGSTLIAAEKVGRRAYLAELDAHYCDVILARWEKYVTGEAVLEHRDDDRPGEAA